MQIFYFTDIYLRGFSGKEKGTRVKIDYLKRRLGSRFTSFSPKHTFKNPYFNLFYLIANDLLLGIKIISLYRKYIIIERSSRFLFTNFIIRVLGLLVISEIHADIDEEIEYIDKSPFQKAVIKRLSKIKLWNYKFNSGIIYNHPYLQDHFKGSISCLSTAVYNGASTRDYYPMNRDLCRKVFELDSEKKIFIFIGSGSNWHGLEYLISIFNSSDFISRSDILLLIVGPSVHRTSVLQKSVKSKNIMFLNEVSNFDAVRLINASDVCLLPVNNVRVSPGSPIKLYDYAACGKPIIAQQNLYGYSDEILNHDLGIVVDFSSTESASKAIFNFINHYDAKYYLRNNRWIALNKINVENRIDSWLDFCYSFCR